MDIVVCKWVFCIKRKADGLIESVAKGFHDFFETFSPVIKPTTIRIILTLEITLGWCLCQVNIQNVHLLLMM